VFSKQKKKDCRFEKKKSVERKVEQFCQISGQLKIKMNVSS